MDEICKMCSTEYPSVNCINCGEQHLHYENKNRHPTNFEYIKSLSKDKMAYWICQHFNCRLCPAYDQSPCVANLMKWFDTETDEHN